jgi:hypothetical protein
MTVNVTSIKKEGKYDLYESHHHCPTHGMLLFSASQRLIGKASIIRLRIVDAPRLSPWRR